MEVATDSMPLAYSGTPACAGDAFRRDFLAGELEKRPPCKKAAQMKALT